MNGYIQVALTAIEIEYRNRVQALMDSGIVLAPAVIIEYSSKLYHEIKVPGISDGGFSESDMLLYQYGINDFGDVIGEHFYFDITRQLIDEESDEPYQLSIALIYDSSLFEGIDSYDCWSDEFPDIESFCTHIKNTDGFRKADTLVPREYRIKFEQC